MPASAQANHMIQQEFEFVAEGDKLGRMVRLLEREMDGSRLLVFCETKRGCDAVTRQLRQGGWPALSIHGDKSQEERDWVLSVRAPVSTVQGPCQGIWVTSLLGSALHPRRQEPGGARLGAQRARPCQHCPGTLSGYLGDKPAWKRSPSTATRARRSATRCSACGPLPALSRDPVRIWV